VLVLALALASAVPRGVAAQEESAPPSGVQPTAAQVRKALDKLATDPNLAAERTVRMLRWQEKTKTEETNSWGERFKSLRRWLGDLFGWVAESGRFLIWTVAALLVRLLAIYLARVIRGRGVPQSPRRFVAPSHVRDLDIRPESLPDDVGVAARALFANGEKRAALALLYRGLLSRLVHEHAVPIRASSTEGDCLALATPRVNEIAAGYVARLVATRQGAVYGGAEPLAADVQALCADFAAALGPPRAAVAAS
jgi:hypothetical protein